MLALVFGDLTRENDGRGTDHEREECNGPNNDGREYHRLRLPPERRPARRYRRKMVTIISMSYSGFSSRHSSQVTGYLSPFCRACLKS